MKAEEEEMNESKRITVTWSVFAAVAVGALLISALVAGPTLAAKGGTKGANNANGNGNGNGNGTTATLTVSPNPAPLGSVVTISGTGFRPDTLHLVGILGYAPWTQLTTDSSGGFSFTYDRTSDPAVFPPGVYYVQAKEDTANGMVVVASATLTIVP